MLDQLYFTSAQVIGILAAFFGLLVAAILIGRYRLSTKVNEDLKAKRATEGRASAVKTRNKHREADVFQYSNIFFSIGLILALSLTILAVNWTVFEDKIEIPMGAMDTDFHIEMEAPPQTAEPPPPPPPPPPVIEEVPDNIVMTEEQQDFTDQSVSTHTAITDAPVASPTNDAAPPPPPPPPPPPAVEVAEIFKVVEEMPRFPGCEDLGSNKEKAACAQQKLLEFIYANIEYPAVARENNVQGTVVVRFVVDEKGKVSGVEVLRDVGAGCGAEAARIVNLMNSMPERWTPGMQRGRPVKVYFTLPVKFVLKVDP